MSYKEPGGRRVAIVLMASGIIGFFAGVVQVTWQDALEPAQVLAGVVRYPGETPQYLYATTTWTAINQALAACLHWGMSERTLSFITSGVQGALSLQALAVFVLALSGDAWLAICASFFIYFTNAARGGVLYPVMLMGSIYTYGAIGLSYLVLTFALMGAGQMRAGMLLLGFAPAVHPSLGLLGIVVVIAAVAFDRSSSRNALVQAMPFFLAGTAVCMASAALRYGLRPNIHIPGIAGDSPVPLAFIRYGAHHRGPFALYSGGILFVWVSAGLATLWSWRFAADLPDHARFLLKILIASAVVGLALSISYWLPSTPATNLLYALMPSRLLNVNVMTCMALTIGLLGRYRDSLSMQTVLALLVVCCCALSMLDREQARSARIGIAAAGVAIVVLTEFHHRRTASRTPPPPPSRALPWLRRAALTAVVAVLLASVKPALTDVDWLEEGDDEGVLATARVRAGLLLTAGDMHQIQLLTRRPVLLDGGALDEMVYVPRAAPLVERILRDVYGVEASQVPNELRPDTGRGLWEGRTVSDWQAVGRQFGVTDVLTSNGWTLNLPVVARSANYILYRIP